MTDQETWLRAEFARTVSSVRPAPDPLGRLLARRRRRRFGRWAAGALTVLVVAVTGGALALSGSPTPVVPPPDSQVEPNQIMVNEPITSQWTRDLLAAPTRGNLAGDRALVDDLTRRMSGRQRTWRVDPALDRVKVLLLAETDNARIAEVAFYNDTRAVRLSLSAPAHSPAGKLASGDDGGSVQGLTPFSAGAAGAEVTGRPAYYYVTALAPPSCQIASSNEARFGPDGTVTLVWQEHGDYLVRAGKDNDRWWRFTCGGVVRHVDYGYSVGARPVAAGAPTATERGQADPALLARALAEWRSLPGLPVSRYRALWGGTAPGSTTPVVVLAGETPTGGVQVCALVGTGEHPSLVTTVPGRALDPTVGKPKSVFGPEAGAEITTAVAPSADLVAVRLPDPDNPFLLSNRLLVVAPPTATRLAVQGGSAVPLTDGVAVVSAPIPAHLTLTALDGKGKAVARLTVAEPDADGLLFNQPLLKRW